MAQQAQQAAAKRAAKEEGAEKQMEATKNGGAQKRKQRPREDKEAGAEEEEAWAGTWACCDGCGKWRRLPSGPERAPPQAHMMCVEGSRTRQYTGGHRVFRA